jgi:undecaprenyl-phosphate galactose phosphotransferase
MVRDADDLLHKHDSKLLEEFKNGDWKMRNDPRVTLVGKILRKLTIDEFPQLINVMRGEMSMVGPRAYLRKELEEQTKRYPETKQYLPLILAAKPGITGVWQTSGRNEIPFTKRAKIDSEYAQHQSITEDLLIILRTPKAMLSKW